MFTFSFFINENALGLEDGTSSHCVPNVTGVFVAVVVVFSPSKPHL